MLTNHNMEALKRLRKLDLFDAAADYRVALVMTSVMVS